MPYVPSKNNRKNPRFTKKVFKKKAPYRRPRQFQKKSTTLKGFKSKQWNPKNRTLTIKY